MSTVQFFYTDHTVVNVPHKKRIRTFITQVFLKENKILSKLDYIFCSDAYLLTINQSHLQHDDYTDIITFDLSEDKQSIIGEIYISVERVKDNSITHKAKFKNELLRVIIHGALHLCGYKDKTKREITIMRQKEDDYLRLFEEII